MQTPLAIGISALMRVEGCNIPEAWKVVHTVVLLCWHPLLWGETTALSERGGWCKSNALEVAYSLARKRC